MATNNPKRNFFRRKGGYRRNEESRGEEFFNLVRRQLDKTILGERYREVQRLKCEALLEGLAISSLPLSVLHLLDPSSDCGCGCENGEKSRDDTEEVSDKPYGPLTEDETYMELIYEYFMLPDSIPKDTMKKALAEPEEPGDDPPLHIAIRDENMDVIRALLNVGVDVNGKGQFGQTPIHTAAVVGSIPILELLVDRGGDLNRINDNKLSALHIAVQQEWPRTTRWLLNKGLDINALDSTVSTPLHWAAFDGNIPMVKLLLGKGARVDIRNAEGHTPFDIARAIGTRHHKIIVGILRSRTPKNFYGQKKESVNVSHDK
nr:ankyrin-1 isoform X1 [Halyomorpha halys]